MKKLFFSLFVISILLMQSSGFAQFWQYQTSGTNEHLNGVFMLDAQTGWICGNAGTLLKTTNGGQNWNQVAVTGNNINSIVFKDVNIGVAVCDNGVIIRTTDGGANWNAVASGTTKQFRKVSSGDGSLFFAAGDSGLVTASTDNGATWSIKNAGTDLRFRGASVMGANKVWVVGENSVIKYSSDAGDSWVDQTSGITINDINDIQFVNESIGFAGASGSNFIFTSDGGQNWVSRNSGIFFDLYGIYFQDTNIGWGVSVVGTIFFTTDGGNSWTSQPCGSAFTLREAYFLNQGKGWTVGDNGTIAMYTDNTVPVELNSFNASVVGNSINLNWDTATETNNRGFEIERRVVPEQSSENDLEYLLVGFVDGHGTSTEKHTYVFDDKNLPEGRYTYRIKQVDYNGNFEYFELGSEVVIEVPNNFSLAQNYPNPFNPTTMIKYSIGSNQHVTLKIYNVLGNEVVTLVNEVKDAGSYVVDFSTNSVQLSSGVYYYQLKSDSFIETKKMILIK